MNNSQNRTKRRNISDKQPVRHSINKTRQTKLSEIESRLKDSEIRYRRLFETAQDGILILDANTSQITDINPFLTEMLGFSKEELVGRKIWEIGPFKNIDASKLAFTELQSKGYIRYENLPIETRDKREIAVEFVSNVYDVNHGRVIQCNIRDITIRKNAEISKAAENLIKSYEKVQKILDETVVAIALICERRDPYTAGHQNRVAQLACAIASEMGMNEEEISYIKIGATLHDIGKIYVPAEILSKPGKLSLSEFEIIKTHPLVGYEIIKTIDFPEVISQIILQHHERLDGSGYPYRLKAGDITIEAKIIAVADVVEAMSSHRPYRPSLGIDKALEDIEKNKGILFDPVVVEACTKIIKKKLFKFD
jgi:PAS domain S-box-containing protein/putative nucleotidyltransferase with HDIG domain